MPSRTSSPRVLLLVATQSYRAGAFVDAARRLGVELVVGSDREQALAAVHPSGHLTLDFRDPRAACATIVARAVSAPLDAVIAADDDGVPIAALAAESLGLRHASAAAVYRTRSKRRVREALRAAGHATPWFRAHSAADAPEAVTRSARYPCVLKPVHLSGSRGVLRADDPEALAAAFQRVVALVRRPDTPRLWTDAALGGPDAAALEPELLLEEYLPGAEVALEGLVRDGRLRVLAIFDKPDGLEGPFFEESIYVTPSRLGAAAEGEIVACAERTLAALGLTEGPVHVEIRWNGRTATLVEIAPRSIGGLCSRALRFQGGASLEEVLLGHALSADAAATALAPGSAGVMMIPISRAGVLRGIEGQDEARATPGVDEIRFTIPIGQQLVPLPEGARYLGFIFARGPTPEGVERALRAAHARLEFRVEGDARDAAPAAMVNAAAAGPARAGET